ncbi:MAG: ABC transporter ATP-binding protein [Alphaproteobacteria bacterium]|nr:ABC transporter ATP-binding protein [Alphaproteobacteria bacterium]
MNKTASSSAPAIETIGLTKRFGERLAVDAVNLTVPAATAFGFLGHNGAGKTTLVRTLLGLTAASSGEMYMLGHRLPAERGLALARVGAIVDEPLFYPHLTGRENLRVMAAVRGGDSASRIPPALERVGLSARADDAVKTYSMGMRQRLGIARCLLCDPMLLILDEPTNGLDPGGILEFRKLVRELVEDEGRTVFLSSHLLDEVEKICDAAAIVDRGRVIAVGTIAELSADDGHTILIGSSDPQAALALLQGRPGVAGVELLADGLRVSANGRIDPAAINDLLVREGIRVWRLEPAHHSLEERFLQMTSRLEMAA